MTAAKWTAKVIVWTGTLLIGVAGGLLFVGLCIGAAAIFVQLTWSVQISLSILAGSGLITAAIWYRKPVQVHLYGPVTMPAEGRT